MDEGTPLVLPGLTEGSARRNLPAMAALSIVLGVLSLACVALGVLLTPVPVLGALFSFAAPALAIAGIIVGGVAMSRAKRAAAQPAVAPQAPELAASAPGAVAPGSPNVALTGVIVSSIALLPALLTAMTCGVCNALCSSGQIQTQRNVQFDFQRGAPTAPLSPDAGKPPAEAGPRDNDAPPPAFPPPPLDPRP